MTIEQYFKDVEVDPYIVKVARGFSKNLNDFVYERGREIVDYAAHDDLNHHHFGRMSYDRLLNNKESAVTEVKDEMFSNKALCYIVYTKIYEIVNGSLNSLILYKNIGGNIDYLHKGYLQSFVNTLDKDTLYRLSERAGAEIVFSGKSYFYYLLANRVIFERLESYLGHLS
jgi:hypothetical protein